MNGQVHRMPTRTIYWVCVGAAALALGQGVGSCARPPSPAPAAEYGYLIVGQGAQSAWGLGPGDSLPEWPAADVPAGVRAEAAVQAHRYEFDASCSRYFGTATVFLTLFRSDCSGRIVDDGEGIAAISQEGALLGWVVPRLSNEYERVWPVERGVH